MSKAFARKTFRHFEEITQSVPSNSRFLLTSRLILSERAENAEWVNRGARSTSACYCPRHSLRTDDTSLRPCTLHHGTFISSRNRYVEELTD